MLLRRFGGVWGFTGSLGASQGVGGLPGGSLRGLGVSLQGWGGLGGVTGGLVGVIEGSWEDLGGSLGVWECY